MTNQQQQHPLFSTRRERGFFSQIALQQASGVDRLKISRLERGGRCVVSFADLAALAKALDAEPGKLLAPGQAVVCQAGDDLATFTGEVIADADPRFGFAQWLGLDPTDPASLTYVDEVREAVQGATS